MLLLSQEPSEQHELEIINSQLVERERERIRFITKSTNNYKTAHYLQKAETQT